MSQKIFIVTEGEYSDYHIEAIFSTKEAAEEYRQTYCSEYGEPGGGSVEEWEVDDPLIYNGFPAGLAAWSVNMKENGDVDYAHLDGKPDADERPAYGTPYFFRDTFPSPAGLKCYIYHGPTFGAWYLSMSVLARNKEHAIKIVNEKRTQLIAMNQWGINPVES